jgi:hypothetical protein
MSGQPWMKFYPSDWRVEPKLKLISREARSLWIDMICLMFEGGTGRLEIDGRPMTVLELSKMLGDNPRTVKKLLAEIELAGVSSRDQGNFIVNRRIIKDRIKAEKDISNGRKGGNPSLIINDLSEKGVNPEVKAQKPEARSQKPEAREVTVLSSAGASEPLAILEKKLRKAAGWEREISPNLAITGPIQALIDSGCILEVDVLPVVKAIAPKARTRSNWNYFINAIQQARDDRLGAMSAPKPRVQNQGSTYAARQPSNSIANSFAVVNAAIEDEERRLDRLRAEVAEGEAIPRLGDESSDVIP